LIWLLAASIGFALWRSDGRLRWYFLAQAVYTVVGSLTYWAFGDTSTAYLAAYSVLTGLILLSVVSLAWDARYWRGMAIAATLAVAVAHLASFGLLSPIRPFEAVGLLEGAILFWAALVLGGTAAYRPNCGINATLSLLWFAQALFRWGFVLNLDETWLWMNWKVPAMLCVVAFTAIGLMRPVRQSECTYSSGR
jgi:hypothetical protein